MSKPKWLIAGLGNPDKKYENTRHNVGFRTVDALAAGKTSKYEVVCEALCVTLNLDSYSILASKPLTYMNSSGVSVKCLLQKYALLIDSLIVIYDDVDLAVGKLRIRRGGSSGGHLGVKSIIEKLGSADFIRVKIGVGRPPDGMDTAAYVLSEERNNEAKLLLNEAIVDAANAIPVIISEGLAKAMNRFNR